MPTATASKIPFVDLACGRSEGEVAYDKPQ